MAESDRNFFADLIDDYYAECDEYLALMRRALLALESCAESPDRSRQQLDVLLRSFHTLKGLSGMVGLREAEQLAHRIESYLRVVINDRAAISTEAMEALMGSVNLVEQVVGAHRSKIPIPDVGPMLSDLASLASEASQATSAGSAQGTAASPVSALPDSVDFMRLTEAMAKGARPWRFEFHPEPTLAQRGINVNVIRSRLQEIGEVIHAVPQVAKDGKVSFEFVVASREDERTFSTWREDGVVFSPYEESALPVHAAVSAAPAGQDPSSRSAAPLSIVRVSLTRLDELMQKIGELVISRGALEENLKRLESVVPAHDWGVLQETYALIERQLRGLRGTVVRIRMVPIGEVFDRMRFLARDLMREHRKTVDMVLQGQETEIDKMVVERMMDPLLHLVRNAVGHGLESPEERMARGKPPEGTLVLRALAAGDMVEIQVEDDGRGIDTDLVLHKARERGMIGSDASDVPDATALLNILCEPGFSTRERADMISGRGVGMSIVKNAVQELGGTLSLDSRAGLGTRFTLRLPLTLAIVDALIVSVSGQRFAVPMMSVREAIEVEPSAVTVFENNEVVAYRGGVLPLIRIARRLGLVQHPGRAVYVLVTGNSPGGIGIVVDRLVGRREIVVRALTDPLVQIRGISGATELGDGRVVLILDMAALARSA